MLLAFCPTLLCVSCGKSGSRNARFPFTVTNLVHEPSAFSKSPTTETIITFTNGSWFGMQSGRVNFALGLSDYEITVFYDPTNRAVTKIIQQYSVGTQRYWLIDRNGDGIPDQRQILGDREEDVFFGGVWLRARGKPQREVFLDGEWVAIHFADGSWRRLK